MKKTLLSLLLAITMLVMLALPAFAATGSLDAKAQLNSEGTGFTVDLIVKDNPGIIAMTSKVSYDSKVFKLKKAENGEIFTGIFMSSQTLKVNPYQTIWMDATADEDIVTNGVLATYTFEVLKNAPVGESEIKFEIAEAVNVNKENVTQFTGCSFKVNVKSNSSEAQPVTSQNGSNITSSSNTNANVNTNSNANGQILEVQKPLVDNTDPEDEDETESSAIQSSEKSETVSSDTQTADNESEDDDEYENDVESKDRTLITVITIAAVLVLGLAVTFTAIYFRKKSGN